MAHSQRAKGRRKGTFAMILGILLLVMAAGLAAYNVWDGARADHAAQMTLEELMEAMRGRTGQQELLPEVREMPTIEIDGYEYIGVLEIPAENISLPVMAQWDMDRLKIAPCVYSGSYFTRDLVIAGHNYARHFSPIKWMDLNTDVYLTTVENVTYHYQVDFITTLAPDRVLEMVERKDWDLTLFTCTTGGRSRCTVRCVLVEE